MASFFSFSPIFFHILHSAVCPHCHPCVDATVAEEILATRRQSNIAALLRKMLQMRYVPRRLLCDLTGKLSACETRNAKTQCHCPTTGVPMSHAKNTHRDLHS